MATQNRLSEISDMVYQWEQLVGHLVEVPSWAIDEMADKPDQYQSLYDIGQYMVGHTGGGGAYFVPTTLNSMPWGQWGMSVTEYGRHLEDFDTAYRALTGQTAPMEVVNRALHEHQGQMTQGQFSTWLSTQDGIKNTYGWLKYGLDYQQFQQQKVSMRTSFGRDLTNEEAVTQLAYLHQAQGANLGARVVPTFSQVQKKDAQTGVGGNVVR